MEDGGSINQGPWGDKGSGRILRCVWLEGHRRKRGLAQVRSVSGLWRKELEA